ncbi:hypothetical protein [Anaerosporobacter faecicola]|uniref:hypothetical protein n=1 Tax=Anaerosporobacter faecicola TaxID=2718714 RepID=UPI001439516D|nr:hypothetical protein [Anaerosporobacter faecicola]
MLINMVNAKIVYQKILNQKGVVVEKNNEEQVEQQENQQDDIWLNGIRTKEENPEVVQAKLAKIRTKLKLGKRLTASEMQFLKEYDMTLYMKAVKLEMTRKMMKEQIRHCKSKEEVQQVIQNQMNCANKTEDAQMTLAAISDESGKVLKSKEYLKLPSTKEEEKREKKKGHIHSCSYDRDQREKEDNEISSFTYKI